MKKDAKIIGIWGGRGSGKTTRLLELLKSHSRVIVFDPVGEFGRKGFKSYTTMAGLLRAVKYSWGGDFRLALDVSRWTISPDEALDHLSQVIFAIQKPYDEGKDNRELTLAIEEMSLSVLNRQSKDGQDSFKKLINLGRHFGVNIFGCSQRPAQVSTDFRGNCADHYIFRVSDHNDVNAHKRIIRDKKLVDQLVSLKPHHYIHWRGMNNIKTGKNVSSYVN